MIGERGYFLIEARWEHSHNAPGEDSFFTVDEIGGSLDDAKHVAQNFYSRHVAHSDSNLDWVIGIIRKKQCYYAHGKFITIRITR